MKANLPLQRKISLPEAARSELCENRCGRWWLPAATMSGLKSIGLTHTEPAVRQLRRPSRQVTASPWRADGLHSIELLTMQKTKVRISASRKPHPPLLPAGMVLVRAGGSFLTDLPQ